MCISASFLFFFRYFFLFFFFFLMIRRPPRSTRVRSSAASDVYKRQARAWPCYYFSNHDLVRHITRFLSLIHISAPTRLLCKSYAFFCMKKKYFSKFFLRGCCSPSSTRVRSSAASDVYKRQARAWPCYYFSNHDLVRHITRFLSLIHISEPTRLLSISYAVFCLKKKNKLLFQKKKKKKNKEKKDKSQNIT